MYPVSSRLPASRFARLLLVASAVTLHFPVTAGGAGVTPEPVPDVGQVDFTFPENEADLTATVTAATRAEAVEDRAAAADRLYRHGWGLWTAVTSPARQSSGRTGLRVYETWLSLDDLVPPNASAPTATASAAVAPRFLPRRLSALRLRLDESDTAALDLAPDLVIGAVKFSPSAADHIRRQRLLEKRTLQTLLDAGAVQVPPFPSDALVVKPVYQLVRPSDLINGRYYLLRVWSGPPATPQSSSPDQWTSGVWVDLQHGGSDAGAVDAAPAPNAGSRIDATTYPVDAFVHYRLSSEDAAALNAAQPQARAAAGDVALLVAMHIAGRELARWTWQTFWWTPAPGVPPLPSSEHIAGTRPPELQGAARHYAMALAYTMLSPEPAYTGGANDQPAVYAYNPYIEARFGPSDLPDSRPGLDPSGLRAANNTGVQSNCLSCHAQATYHPAGSAGPRFTGARYVDLIDPQYVGTLQTEFLWSLPRHAN